jgi:molybdenum cofactor synthesis domain-containing protein
MDGARPKAGEAGQGDPARNRRDDGMTTQATGDIVTAGFVVIGDEILSGRTKDKNIGYLAEFLTAIGVDLSEVRIVPDVEERIVEAVNALRARYTYVFTSGGIGPTHDDITADAIGKAFGVPVDHDPRAVEILTAFYPKGQLTEARLRMARIPQGADLIENAVSRAPGFRIGCAGKPDRRRARRDPGRPRRRDDRVLSPLQRRAFLHPDRRALARHRCHECSRRRGPRCRRRPDFHLTPRLSNRTRPRWKTRNSRKPFPFPGTSSTATAAPLRGACRARERGKP